jgi:hypothetical protein
VHDACSGVESRVGVHIRGRKVSVERTRWKALRVQMGPPLTGWSSKHPGCAGELEADAQACVSTATGRCNGADTVVPAERHGASEIGSDSGKGSSSSRRRGGSASQAALPVPTETSGQVRRTRCIGTNRSKRAQAYSSVLSSLPSARTERGGKRGNPHAVEGAWYRRKRHQGVRSTASRRSGNVKTSATNKQMRGCNALGLFSNFEWVRRALLLK